MVHCGCAAATVLVACLSGATAMPDNDGRPYWKELMSAESPAPPLQRDLTPFTHQAFADAVRGLLLLEPAV